MRHLSKPGLNTQTVQPKAIRQKFTHIIYSRSIHPRFYRIIVQHAQSLKVSRSESLLLPHFIGHFAAPPLPPHVLRSSAEQPSRQFAETLGLWSAVTSVPSVL